MTLNRIQFGVLVMLLALLLPLQGYAAMPDCGHFDAKESGAAALTASPAGAQHCAGAPGAIHHHGCGNCCCTAAIMLTPVRFTAPALAARQISAALSWSPPTVALDRLDRPPRFILV
jgi:hypothetical protein